MKHMSNSGDFTFGKDSIRNVPSLKNYRIIRGYMTKWYPVTINRNFIENEKNENNIREEQTLKSGYGLSKELLNLLKGKRRSFLLQSGKNEY